MPDKEHIINIGAVAIPPLLYDVADQEIQFDNIKFIDRLQKAYLTSLSGASEWLICRIMARKLAFVMKNERINTGNNCLPVFASGEAPCFAYGDNFACCAYASKEVESAPGLDAEKIFSDEESGAIRNYLQGFLPKKFFCHFSSISPRQLTRLWTVGEALYKFLKDDLLFLEVFSNLPANVIKWRRGFFCQSGFYIGWQSFAMTSHWLTVVYDARYEPALSFNWYSWRKLLCL